MPFIDLHCDTVSEVLDHPDAVHHITPEQLRKSDVSLQCFALFTNIAEYDPPEQRAFSLYGAWQQYLRDHSDTLMPVCSWQDYLRARKQNRTGALLTLEEGDVLFGDLSFLETWHRLGVRMITLTWNHENALADRQGLTPFGKACLRKMEDLGILADVSHLNDRAFRDVAKMARRPFAASHSNARKLCDVPRNLTDDMIRAIADAGGVIGLNFCGLFLNPEAGGLKKRRDRILQTGDKDQLRAIEAAMEASNVSKVDDMICHIRHIMEIGGEDVIALGTDFDGITSRLEIPDASKLPMLTDRMRQAGFTDRQIEKFTHVNAERVLQQVLENTVRPEDRYTE